MSTLYYISTNTVPKGEAYSLIHKCKKCPYNTKSRFFIQNHVRGHFYRSLELFNCLQSNLENFLCEECNFSTFLLATFREHIKNHSVKSEDAERNLQKANKDTDSANKIYGCEEIDSKTFTSKNFEWFFCNECSHKSRWKKHLKAHIINKHRPADAKWFQCEWCSHKSRWKEAIRRHINSQHRPAADIKWFQCDECSHKTIRKVHLKEHIINQHRPADIKWFQCDECSYKSKWKGDLQRHAKKHESAKVTKWFQCTECSYKCKQKSNLKQHVINQHRPAEICVMNVH